MQLTCPFLYQLIEINDFPDDGGIANQPWISLEKWNSLVYDGQYSFQVTIYTG